MNIKQITSNTNKQIKWIKKLQAQSKERYLQSLYVVEGKKQVLELNMKTVHTLILDERADLKLFESYEGDILILTQEIFKSVSLDKTPQGYMAIAKMNRYQLESQKINENGLYLLLESIQDPGNMGTMIRVCDAVKADGIIYNKESVDIYHPKVVKSTVGSLNRVKCYQVDDLTQAIHKLQSSNIRVFGAYLDDSSSHFSKHYHQGTAFVIGNEGNGISDKVINCVDERVTIPILGGAESLNAAVAASVLLYEAIRQRKDKSVSL
jgi:TrmH family RNA methyltransferase